MKIGILGSGDVAKTLGSGFISRGHDVMLGTRDLSKLSPWLTQAGPRAHAGSFAEASAFGELLVLATRGVGTVETIASAGPVHFSGKVVLDATNPLEFSDRGPRLAVGFSDSLGEQIQRAIPDARVVKGFNTVGAPLMIDPDLPGGPPDMFIAGNDGGAKTTISEIAANFGWNVVDLGGIEEARLLEPLCMVWVLYGARTGAWTHAFKLLKK